MDSPISTAWKAAAVDLGIQVAAPSRLPVGEHVAAFDALIGDFGSAGGTAVVPLGEATPIVRQLAGKAGVFLSELSPDAYGEYDRALFIETLNDWVGTGRRVKRPSG